MKVVFIFPIACLFLFNKSYSQTDATWNPPGSSISWLMEINWNKSSGTTGINPGNESYLTQHDIEIFDGNISNKDCTLGSMYQLKDIQEDQF